MSYPRRATRGNRSTQVRATEAPPTVVPRRRKGVTERHGRPDVGQLFRQLARSWKLERGLTSSVVEMAMHPAYQRIIGLGPAALPFILRELQRRPDHWFWALTAITGENPVPRESRGDLALMARAWSDWARERGLSPTVEQIRAAARA